MMKKNVKKVRKMEHSINEYNLRNSDVGFQRSGIMIALYANVKTQSFMAYKHGYFFCFFGLVIYLDIFWVHWKA